MNDPSLENLSGTFDEIKAELAGKPGAEQVAYRQGDPGEVDVQQILQVMSLFDLARYPDRKAFPNKLFRQQRLVLAQFVEDKDKEFPVFSRILPRLHELLVLGDIIQKKLAPEMGRLKVSGAKKANRAASAKLQMTAFATFAIAKESGEFKDVASCENRQEACLVPTTPHFGQARGRDQGGMRRRRVAGPWVRTLRGQAGRRVRVRAAT